MLEQFCTQQHYHPRNVFNMDKTGYAKGDLKGKGVLPTRVLRYHRGLPIDRPLDQLGCLKLQDVDRTCHKVKYNTLILG